MNEKHRIVGSCAYAGPKNHIKQYMLRYITEEIERSNYIIFQSDFNFMGCDTPFTLIVMRTNEGTMFNVTWWMNDWGTFHIETPVKHYIAKRWRLDRLTKKTVKNNESLTAREMIEGYGFRQLACTKVLKHLSSITFPELTYEISNMFNEYNVGIETPFTNGKVAIIYKEAL
jgi:hypothetical protein